jgi:hypothetical protein
MRTNRVLVSVLGAIHTRLISVEDEAERTARILGTVVTKLDTLVDLVVALRSDIEGVRSRLLEEASRQGEELHRQNRAIVGHEARLHRLERAASGTR